MRERALWLSGLVCLAVACGAAPQGETPPPNVLLVSIDTLRADHVGAYGATFAETPHLDEIARTGTRFATAISPTPLTLPSHATLLTGLDPVRHGVRHNGVFKLPEHHTTLAESFREAGYATGAVVASTVLDARYGLAQGFEDYEDDVVVGADRIALGGERLDASHVSDKAIRWLGTTAKPFFLFVHYYDAHASYQPPPPFEARFADRPYDGEIAYVDQNLGRILDALEQDGRAANTWIVVTADHGESLGEHGEVTHAYSIYDATQHVPLLVRGPGVPANRVVEGVVRLADVAPTLWSGLDVPGPSALDGEDLSPLWREGAPRSERIAYAETLATQIDHGWSPLHAVRTGEHLHIRAPRPELYDAASDPGQQRNLWPNPLRGAALEAALDARLAATGAAETVLPDADTRRQLQALGYALPDAAPPSTGLDPKDGLRLLARYHEAEAANHAGDFVTGEAILTALVAEQPRSAGFRSALAATHLASGRPTEALPHARLVTEWVPDSAGYWGMLARAESAVGNLEAALGASDRALALDGSDGALLLERMELEAHLGRLDEVARFGERARTLDPANVAVGRRIADQWETLGRSEEAVAAYRKVLAVDPASDRDHMHAAIHLARMGRIDEALRHRAHAGAVAQDPRAQRMWAQGLTDGGAADRAVPIYRALLGGSPDDETLRAALANAEAAAADHPPARLSP